MELREAYEKYKKFKIPSLSVICKKANQYSKTCLFIVAIFFLIFIYLIQQVPHWQVAQFEISNATEKATLENQYRATLAQILGGSAVLLGLYFAWGNLITSREGQITERFTRAVNQLGNPAIEIRLGGIYALERISNESEEDYWPIMEILTAYVRKNSFTKDQKQSSVSEDIKAILSVIRRRKYFFKSGENVGLDLNGTYLKEAYLEGANLKGANLEGAFLRKAQLKGADLRQAQLKGTDLLDAHLEKAHLEEVYLEETYLGMPDMNPKGVHLEEAHLEGAHLGEANLFDAYLEGAQLIGTHLEGAQLIGAHLKGAQLIGAHLKGTEFGWTDLRGADFEDADLRGADLEGADLRGAINLTIGQLSKVKTLYETKLDEKLLKRLETETECQKLFENPHLEKA